MGEGERVPEPGGETPFVAPGSSGDPAATALSEPPTLLNETSPLRLAHRRGQRAADLRQKLDEKAAATDELREALDELRQVLDVDNTPPPANRRSRRTWLVAAVVGALVLTVLTGWLLSDGGSGSIVAGTPTTADPSPTASAGAGSGAATTGAGTTTRPDAAASVRPLPWPGGAVLTPPGLTTTGPGASTPGTDVQVAIDPDGQHLDVFERLRLEGPSTDPLALAAPTLPALSAGIQVSDLQVQLDDQAVPVVPDGPGSWSATPAAGTTYTTATLRYRMAGSVVAITPAAPGRRLGVVTPLTGLISAGHGHDVQVRATSGDVLGVTCPTAPRGSVCGIRTATGWTAGVPADARPIVVLLQLNARR